MVKVLLIDDDRFQAPLVQAYLDVRYDSWFEFVSVTSLHDGLKALDRMSFDVILLDDKLRPYKGCEQTLPALHPYLGEASLIIISASAYDIEVPVEYADLVTTTLDKFELRRHILAGALTGPPGPVSDA